MLDTFFGVSVFEKKLRMARLPLAVLLVVALIDARFFCDRPRRRLSKPKRAQNMTSELPPIVLVSPTMSFDDESVSVTIDPVLGYLMLS